MLQLLGFVIDCPNALTLATFYAELTGCALMEGSEEASAGIHLGDVGLTFQRIDDYRPPCWPDGEHPKQYHLDFEVDLLEVEQRRAVDLGATLHEDHVGTDGFGWHVYTDPAGPPFCLCRHAEVRWINGQVAWT